jgi:hypothetical protein
VVERLAAVLVACLALALPALARPARAPPDTQPDAANVFVLCSVTEGGVSTNCRFYAPVADPTERLRAGTELGYLDAHPFPIPGAKAGANVKVLARLRVSAGAAGQGFAVAAPEGAFPIPVNSEIKDPVWIDSPRAAWTTDLVDALAARNHQDGEATARCTVAQSGALGDCWIERETPSGIGFGEAALIVLQHARMKPLSASGVPVAGRGYVQRFIYRSGDLDSNSMAMRPGTSQGMAMGMAPR